MGIITHYDLYYYATSMTKETLSAHHIYFLAMPKERLNYWKMQTIGYLKDEHK